jgi:helicase
MPHNERHSNTENSIGGPSHPDQSEESALKFHGLFVGIDRYAAPGISWLSSASRDAIALHALFGDTFGTTANLLTDGQATVAALRDKLAQLAANQHPG